MWAHTLLFKRKENGIYYFREAVPNEIRPIIGKTEMRRSLRTSNLSAAKSNAH